ncbi:MAG TPA: hypothetical protein PKN48_01105 [Bacteroidales bacterium]|nr:hypothetical protein [Bacteroidales bacterium]
MKNYVWCDFESAEQRLILHLVQQASKRLTIEAIANMPKNKRWLSAAVIIKNLREKYESTN